MRPAAMPRGDAKPSALRPTVVKIGGSVLERSSAGEAVLDRVARAWKAGEPILVVHGGGAELSRWLGRLGIATRFVRGQRVTSDEVLQVALMVLGGLINRRIVEGLLRRGCSAIGLTGADGRGAVARPVGDGLGSVGRIVSVNTDLYLDLLEDRRLPVVASLAWSARHGWLNVNADLMAAAFAAGLRARRLLLMTDVDGVQDARGSTIPVLTLGALLKMIDSGEARDGMIPKLLACVTAAQARVAEIRIAPDYPGTPGGDAGTRVIAEPRRAPRARSPRASP